MIYQKEIIASRLASERKRNGYTQETLAETNIASKPTIVSWERADGKNRIPTLEQLLELCELYGCEVGYLLGEYDTRTRVATDVCKETGLSEEAVDLITKSKEWEEDSLGRFLNFFIPRCGTIMATLSESIKVLSKDTFNQKYSDYHVIKKIYEEASRPSYKAIFPAVNTEGRDTSATLFLAMLYYFLMKHEGKIPENLEEEDFFAFVAHTFAADGFHFDFEAVPTPYKHRYAELYNELKASSERTRKEREYIINDLFLDIIKEYVRSENLSFNEKYCKMLDNQ